MTHALVTATVNIYDVAAMQEGVGRFLVIATVLCVAILVWDHYFPGKPKPPKR